MKEILLARLKKKSVDTGDCWIWQGAMSGGGITPSMNWERQPQNVRRLVATVLLGLDATGKVVSNKCEDTRCVCPDHIQVMTRKALQKRSSRDYGSDVMRSKRIAAKARTRAKLTPEQIEAIRASSEPQRDLAEQYGVRQSTISLAKRFQTWKDYSNPFAQLIGGTNARR